MTPSSAAARVPDQLAAHERLLWGLCYRMTGSAADADDLVQDTFVRALERPPKDASEIRPWLVRVAVNLARDRLRARKRRRYVGPWLPSPVPTEALADVDHDEPLPSFDGEMPVSPGQRYELVESVSIAFLLALEALSPRQRAVVLLCDVFDHSVKEAADALGVSEANVKVLHHRARRALAGYDAERVDRRGLASRTREALQAFAAALASGDEAAARALLADDAVGLNDGGGLFVAARKPLVGAARCAKGNVGVTRHAAAITRIEIVVANGLPALLVEFGAPPRPNLAPRVLMQVELDGAGRIRRIYNMLVPEKLARFR